MMVLVLVSVLSVAAGLALGLLGGGGSILAVPILVYAGGLDTRTAIPTSLLVVGVSSAVAALAHGLRGGVDVRAGVTLGVASMVGAFAGARVGQHLPSALLLAGFTAVMIVTAIAMMRRRTEEEPSRAAAAWPKTTAVGLGVGLLTGLVGAGGGFIIVPALTLLCGISMRRAVGTSLLVIAMNSIAGFAGALGQVELNVALTVAATIAVATGSLVGVVAASRITPSTLRRAFAWLVLAMSLFMVVKQLPSDILERGRAALPYFAAIFVGAGAVGLVFLRLRFAGHWPFRSNVAIASATPGHLPPSSPRSAPDSAAFHEPFRHVSGSRR